ncbi:MAG: cation-efflux pump, partial [Ruthenibacterium sp.]
DFAENDNLQFVIHYDPILVGDEAIGTQRTWMEQRLHTISPALTLHDFRMVAGPSHTNLIFDVVTPLHFPLSDTELKARIQALVENEEVQYYTVVTIDKSYAPVCREKEKDEE